MTPTAIVTGGTGGMGLATAKLLGKDHRVVVADLDIQRLDAAVSQLEEFRIEAVPAVCDITDQDSVQRLFHTAETGGHHVRAVVHAAGISPQMGSAATIARVNGTGTVHVSRTFLARAGEGDVLVNVASTAGYLPAFIPAPTRAFRTAETDPAAFERAIVRRARMLGPKLHTGLAYSFSKAFVQWYSRDRAVAFAKRGARVLSVSPGSFDTTMGRLEEKSGSAAFLRTTAIKRFGRPEEIAAVLAFCSGTAPAYLTGVDILVDGGSRAGAEFAKRR
jgi:NAD(P)-dependent dehydrogenase (short-subunit alcohol dehydrogenase family)